eukprot:CAMPEP_0179266960 /NCGR_PEP_ID=MMETSP0797-20121207/29681_1 /TAXON_ID=47934 /ORGANISM="Dinophysis acuminata, Strain DAEP01" /LENGTH=38 /DNA_ID= /DNA_START= /DNA_END= /DNA_ORIENTATION=
MKRATSQASLRPSPGRCGPRQTSPPEQPDPNLGETSAA